MMASNVRCAGNTNAIQVMRTPTTPITVSSAGTSEMPKPRRYPDMTSYSMLNV